MKKTFIYYANKRVNNKDYTYLKIQDDELDKLVSRFINYNSLDFEKTHSSDKTYCIWNGSIMGLTYIIYYLHEKKKNGFYLFERINILNFIEFTFHDKNNKRIGEETIKRNLNRIKNKELSKAVRDHEQILGKML